MLADGAVAGRGRRAVRRMLVGGAALGALAVASGAFGAHALEGVLDERARGWYDTAVTYHAGHALALVACGLLALHVGRAGSRALAVAGVAFAAGIALFSGSLYLMAFTGWTRLGMITPLGGVALIAGWIAFAVAAARLPSPPAPGGVS